MDGGNRAGPNHQIDEAAAAKKIGIFEDDDMSTHEHNYVECARANPSGKSGWLFGWLVMAGQPNALF